MYFSPDAWWGAEAKPSEMLLIVRQFALASERKLKLFVAACREQIGQSVVEIDDLARRMGGMLTLARAWTDAHSEANSQPAILRDLFGDPWHPVIRADVYRQRQEDRQLDPRIQRVWRRLDWHIFPLDWLSDPVVGIARSIDEDGDFSILPILGDALQDAGCNDEMILRHCRQGQHHYRGCWLIDGILGLS
ncbi:MAG: hypothetical protein KatS3mg105_4178 [Gemmatales bacterium]|nr:MAG: hypothetical protein KatS3mg105_4178 [Gemmatales bacterium]